jgi:two-component system, OmpR family, sensor kinase
MSIRLRLTLLYSAILVLTLLVFGTILYTIQSQSMLNSLKRDLMMSSERLRGAVTWMYLRSEGIDVIPQIGPGQSPPLPPLLEPGSFSAEPSLSMFREREIVRVLNISGELVASPFGTVETALPLSKQGLRALTQKQNWWETADYNGEQVLIYDRPGIIDDQVVFIIQIARGLTEHDRSLSFLSRILIIAGLLTTLAAFGIGWVLAGAALSPIQRITQTAQDIGKESDFSRRVSYLGPKDEIGELAITFNSMLARLQEAYQRVSETLRLQRGFVADVSHELRTPLTTVRGNLALLSHDPPLPASEQSEILRDVEEESDRLIRLVNGLLVLARADSGQHLARETVAIRQIVEEACSQAQLIDEEREILQEIQELNVLGDRDAIKQILLILLENALKYSQTRVLVTAESLESDVIIRVQDHGSGIDPKTLDHIFERFYRGEEYANIPGFGLGLPIAQSLVTAQGGSIQVESVPGTGTTVRVILPKADPGAAI